MRRRGPRDPSRCSLPEGRHRSVQRSFTKLVRPAYGSRPEIPALKTVRVHMDADGRRAAFRGEQSWVANNVGSTHVHVLKAGRPAAGRAL